MEGKKDWKQGLSNGHIAQIVRRKNVVRVVSSKKTYSRKQKTSYD
jgi:ribosomal protein L36